MPVRLLSAKVVKTLACPEGQTKIDFHDSGCKGLMLEIRATGGSTWYIRYRDLRGKQHQFRIADAQDLSFDLARKRVDELRTKIAQGEDPSAEKALLRSVPTFSEFVAERYMPFIRVDKRSWISDDSYLRNHLLPAFGKLPMDTITKRQVIEFHHGMQEKGYAVGTANRCLVLLRYIFNLSIRWEVPTMVKNPTKDVALFKDEMKCERYLTKDEAQRLYASLEDSDNQLLKFIIPMLILTGARKREALDAKWEDFDLARRQWRIPFSKVGLRYVPLSTGVLQLLDIIPRLDGNPYVFPSPVTGKPFISFFYSWNTARKHAGLADVRIHDLRHSFASFLVNAGRSLYEVQKILGHTQIRTTQRYAHLSQETLIDAANAAVDALGMAFAPVSKAVTVAITQKTL
jgi:integrase